MVTAKAREESPQVRAEMPEGGGREEGREVEVPPRGPEELKERPGKAPTAGCQQPVRPRGRVRLGGREGATRQAAPHAPRAQ